ncbi:hypothetical protein EXIGLDRAFT_737086 [Exidia glandulosa HHB12029]|uniref:Uncharacterized protein n=1 Tax=Exidia glandulosa HHB12029 TaxID=1314781 RepID=A0A165J4S7_EXIGL|nr:hypothetical protein EXIGLDRAFT_737086 [Exidia glandulosa HHB12029]
MNTLAPEILGSIFLLTTAAAKRQPNIYYLESETSRSLSRHDPIAVAVCISAVCRYWRGVALGYPALWTCIVIDLQSRDYEPGTACCNRRFELQDAYISTIIPRYRQYTTELTILESTCVRKEHWPHLRRWWDLLAPRAHSVYLCAGMWWEQPSLSEVPIQFDETIFSLLATPLPYLECCVLRSEDFVHGMRDLEGLLPASPALRTLILYGISVRRILNALGTTAISTLVLWEDTELDHLWNLKDKAPKLEKLVLRTAANWSTKLRPPTSLRMLVLHTRAQSHAFDQRIFTSVQQPVLHPRWQTNESLAIHRIDEVEDMDEFTDSSISTDTDDSE